MKDFFPHTDTVKLDATLKEQHPEILNGPTCCQRTDTDKLESKPCSGDFAAKTGCQGIIPDPPSVASLNLTRCPLKGTVSQDRDRPNCYQQVDPVKLERGQCLGHFGSACARNLQNISWYDAG